LALHIHRAARTDALADQLATLLAQRPTDPFARELVVVPAKGIERWLTQRLSHRLGVGERGGDGVCAAVDFVRPSSLVALLNGTQREDPWRPDRLVWPVLRVIDSSLDQPWCRPIATHLGHFHVGVEADVRRSRRYALARRLAGLFANYAEQRPLLLAQWQAGQQSDGAGGQLADDLLWQPELWRRVIDQVSLPAPHERHAETLESLREGPQASVPERLSLFGHTRLARSEIELLEALGVHHDVHLWLPEVSADLTARLELAVEAGPVRRADDTSVQIVGHPLLASLGRDTRELTRSLAHVGERAPIDTSPVAAGPPSLLSWLQADLAADVTPDAPQRVLDADDHSVQIHACHGQARQVEVLREVLVGLLQDDPDLQPRDIVIMCPDVEAYAPLIQASFGLGADAGLPSVGSHPAHRLRVRLADRGVATTNPLLGVARQLMTIASGRAGVTQMLDLISTEPVRRRFALNENDLERTSAWLRDSGIRWGFSAEHRAPYGLDWIGQNTWFEGINRILLGVTMTEDGAPEIGHLLPLDSVSSGDIELAGKLAELVARVQSGVEAMLNAGPAPDWMAALRTTVDSITSVSLRDAWMQAEFDRELMHIADEGTGANEVHISLADVRSLLEFRLDGRPTRSNFRTGTLTVCTLTPMRSVPHRVVCLLGLDDGTFPRVNTVDGDDVMARAPMTGERDPRSEDRQLLLDAVMSAQQQLIITYSGASEHSGQSRPPAVPVGELIDALERTASGPVRAQILVHHPLQPFSERNYTSNQPDSVRHDRPFSFDAISLTGALARRHQQPGAPLVAGVLDKVADAEVGLEAIKAWWRNPARAFLRAQDVALAFDEEQLNDAIPLELDNLQRWAIGARAVQALSSGTSPEQVLHAERLRGNIPPGQLGDGEIHKIVSTASRVVQAASNDLAAPAIDVEIGLDLASRRLQGYVPQVRGDQIVALSYSSMGPGLIADAWVDVLALAAQTDQPARAVIHARYGQGARRVNLGPISPADALTHLETLAGSLDQGQREPIPLPLRTGLAWARRHGERDQWWKARKVWDPGPRAVVPGEIDDAAFSRVYGANTTIDDLLAAGLDSWAMRAWGPLLHLTKGQY